MKLNTDKCHLLILSYKHEHIWADVREDKIQESINVKLLGTTKDRKLKFDKIVSKLYSKASRKLSALSRMSKYFSFDKRITLVKAFAESQFKYCPFIWMFNSRNNNNKINRLHERALSIVHDNYESCFEQLLETDLSVSIHHQNIHRLLMKMYKASNKISGNNFSQLFIKQNNNLNLRSKPELLIPLIYTVNKG